MTRIGNGVQPQVTQRPSKLGQTNGGALRRLEFPVKRRPSPCLILRHVVGGSCR
jgi:hypothetical protein